MIRRARTTALAALLILGSAVVAMISAGPAHADTVICDKFGSTSIQGGKYIVQNNEWGSDDPQCITVTGTGFTISTANFNKATNGAPASYPSIYAGCHYANCTAGSGLPMQATSSQFGSVRSSVGMSYVSTGQWDAAYDIWFDPTPRTDGQNTGAEIMIWLNHLGAPQPVGSRVATVSLAGGTWDVWFGNIGWNVVSYVRTTATSSIDFTVSTFFSDAVSRGYAQNAWYLTSVQAGFEPWVGGQGLAVNTFSYSVGTSGDTTPPSAPQNLTAANVTSSGANLSWSASTDNVGVTGYDVFRSQNGGSFSRIGSASGTSFAVTGLAGSTSYSFYVTAHDAAGNNSGPSNTVNVTTPSGGGGGLCRVTYTRTNEWVGGFTADVAISNTGTSTVNGWTLAFTFPGDQRITNAWNAAVTQSGAAVSARDLGYNAVIGPGVSTSFGFQGTWTSNDSSPTSFTLNGTACATG